MGNCNTWVFYVGGSKTGADINAGVQVPGRGTRGEGRLSRFLLGRFLDGNDKMTRLFLRQVRVPRLCLTGTL